MESRGRETGRDREMGRQERERHTRERERFLARARIFLRRAWVNSRWRISPERGAISLRNALPTCVGKRHS
eukprot:6202709-Pleurochrysis_carterae.AAC.6